MATPQQEAFCILQFAKTKSVTTVQRLFRTRFGFEFSGYFMINMWKCYLPFELPRIFSCRLQIQALLQSNHTHTFSKCRYETRNNTCYNFTLIYNPVVFTGLCSKWANYSNVLMNFNFENVPKNQITKTTPGLKQTSHLHLMPRLGKECVELYPHSPICICYGAWSRKPNFTV
jgi:hypothetical protein